MKTVFKNMAMTGLPKASYKIWMFLYSQSQESYSVENSLLVTDCTIIKIQMGTCLNAASVYSGIRALTENGFVTIRKNGRNNWYYLSI